eukprot:m.126024 g.126024  ORF g.126024 m.126024 type:complete len:1054 (-) comp29172_c0_seq1:75-3236(-)
MDLSQSGESHRKCKILVAPLFPCTPSAFARFFEAIKEGYESVVQQPNDVILDFVKEVPDDTWNDFQYHRRVLGVVGVVDCRGWDQVPPTEQDLEELRSDLPSVLQTCTLGFNARASIPRDKKVTLIPASRNNEHAKLTKNLADLMKRFGNSFSNLLAEIADQKAQAKEKPENIGLLRAAVEDTQPLQKESKMFGPYRRRCVGRYHKQLGDIFVMQGKLDAAVNAYLTAQKILRDINDWLWLGSVMEGYAICLQLRESADPAIDADDITARYLEASQLYCKVSEGCVPRCEAHFKLARYHQSKGKKHVFAAMQAISSAFNGKLDLDPEQELQLYTDAGIFFHHLGLKRKSSFFLRRAALCQLKYERWEFAGALLLKLASVYKLENLPKFLEGQLDFQREETTSDDKGWPMLQAMLLRDIMWTFMKLNAVERTARVVAYFCQRITNSKAKQILPGLLAEVGKSQKITICPQGLVGVPEIHNCSARKLDAELQPTPIVGIQATSSSPFIYSPFGPAKVSAAKKVVWVAKELVHVNVSLSNVLPIEIVVESICLYTEGLTFDAYPLTYLKLPPEVQDIEVTLQGKAHAPGDLKIMGYVVRAFNVDAMHWLKKSLDVSVISPLPQLKVYAEVGSVGNDHVLNIYRGQQINIALRLENVGLVNTEKVRVKMEWLGTKETSDVEMLIRRRTSELLPPTTKMKTSGLILDSTELQNSLPLRPGENTTSSLSVIAHDTDSPTIRLTWEYYSTDDDEIEGTYFRTVVRDVPLKVKPAVDASDLQLLQCARTPSTGSSSDTDAPHPETHLLFSFELRNRATAAFQVNICFKGKQIRTFVLQGLCKSTMHVIVPKLELTDAIRDTEGKDAAVISKLIINRLKKLIQIDWCLSLTQGRVHLPTQTLSEATIRVLQNAPVKIRCTVPKCTELTIGTYECKVNTVITVWLTVTNVSSITWRPMLLSILPIQTMENGRTFYQTVDQLQSIGKLETIIPALKSQESFVHKVSFFCRTKGVHIINNQCRWLPEGEEWKFGEDPESNAAAKDKLNGEVVQWSSYPTTIQVVD